MRWQIWVACAVVMGCGGGGGSANDAGTPPDPITLTEFREGLRDAACDWIERCRGQIPCTVWGRWPTFDAQTTAMLDAVAGGRLEYDGVSAAACLEVNRNNSCNSAPLVAADPDYLGGRPDTAVCLEVLTGQIEPGDSCYTENAVFGDECQGGSSCAADGNVCPGACELLGDLGMECNYDGRRCKSELWCEEGKCAPRLKVGDPCGAGVSCPVGTTCTRVSADSPDLACLSYAFDVGDACDGLYTCLGPRVCYQGTCRETVPSGAPCTTVEQCPAGDLCFPIGQDDVFTCHPPIAVGQPCNLSDTCAEDLICAQLNSQSERRCQERGSVNDECGGDTCEEGLFCASGSSTCQTIANDGEACDRQTRKSCVEGTLCMDDQKCHPIGELGEPCQYNNSDTCVDGLFCDINASLCSEPGAQGEFCSPADPSESCEEGLYCDCVMQPAHCAEGYGQGAGTDEYQCVDRLVDGANCVANVQCASGYCANDTGKCGPIPPNNDACTGP